MLADKPAKINKIIVNLLLRNVVAPEFIALRNEVTELIKWW